MTTITQTITALPTAPARTDDPATFITRADAMMAALPTLVTQENTWAGQVNTVAGEVNTNATTATTQAGIATTQAGLATTNGAAQVTLATTQATNAAASAVTAVSAPGTSATSTTSNTVAVGSKTMTIQTGKSLVVGAWIVCAETANPATNYMVGAITSYDSGTGSLTFLVTTIGGSGTYSAWTVSLTAAGSGASSGGGAQDFVLQFNGYDSAPTMGTIGYGII